MLKEQKAFQENVRGLQTKLTAIKNEIPEEMVLSDTVSLLASKLDDAHEASVQRSLRLEVILKFNALHNSCQEMNEWMTSQQRLLRQLSQNAATSRDEEADETLLSACEALRSKFDIQADVLKDINTQHSNIKLEDLQGQQEKAGETYYQLNLINTKWAASLQRLNEVERDINENRKVHVYLWNVESFIAEANKHMSLLRLDTKPENVQLKVASVEAIFPSLQSRYSDLSDAALPLKDLTRYKSLLSIKTAQLAPVMATLKNKLDAAKAFLIERNQVSKLEVSFEHICKQVEADVRVLKSHQDAILEASNHLLHENNFSIVKRSNDALEACSLSLVALRQELADVSKSVSSLCLTAKHIPRAMLQSLSHKTRHSSPITQLSQQMDELRRDTVRFSNTILLAKDIIKVC